MNRHLTNMYSPIDVKSFREDERDETSTSITKSAAKLGLASVAGSNLTRGKGGLGVLAGAGALAINTKDTKTIHKVTIQFNDLNIFEGTLSGTEFSHFMMRYNLARFGGL